MQRNAKPHQADRASALPWEETIPSHWEVRTLRSVLKPVNVRDHAELPLLSVVRERGVILRDLDNTDDNHNVIPEDLSNYKLVRPKQFAINKMKAWQGSYGVSQDKGIVSPAYFVFDVRNIDPAFLHRATRSRAYVPLFNRASDGVRIGQWDLSLEHLRDIPIAIPPPEEQAAIVRYLDHADGLINRYISAKERLIALLREQRQAVIHQAVTRGLDQNVPLKPSGVSWLGDMPRHWESPRLRYLGKAIIGLTYDPQNVTDVGRGILVFRASNIRDGRITYEDCVYVGSRVPSLLITRPGDILICSRSGSRALIGKNAKIDANSAGNTFGAFMTVFRSETNDYLHYVFNSNMFEHQSAMFATSTVNQLTLGMINDMKIPFPPPHEQEMIVGYLDQATAKIDQAIIQTKRQIGLIREYHTRLIADVVTGQIDVRDATVELPDQHL